jgi:uncharacterized protein YdcH (DUF465 family)
MSRGAPPGFPRCDGCAGVVECALNPGVTLNGSPASKEAAMPDAQDLKEQLLRTDAEYRELYQLHHELDEQIRSMATNPHPSESEQLEEVQLKKRKLQLKDRMEDIVRRYESPPTSGPSPNFAHA